jgi:hypothetical protein
MLASNPVARCQRSQWRDRPELGQPALDGEINDQKKNRRRPFSPIADPLCV